VEHHKENEDLLNPARARDWIEKKGGQGDSDVAAGVHDHREPGD